MRSPHRFPRAWSRRLAALAAALALAGPAPHGVFRPAKLAGPSPAAYALKAPAPGEGTSAAGLEERLRGVAGLEGSTETAEDLRRLAERFEAIEPFAVKELGEIRRPNPNAERLDVGIEISPGDRPAQGRTVRVVVHGLGRGLQHLAGTAIVLRGTSWRRVQLQHEEGTGVVAEFSNVPAANGDDDPLAYTLELAAGLEEPDPSAMPDPRTGRYHIPVPSAGWLPVASAMTVRPNGPLPPAAVRILVVEGDEDTVGLAETVRDYLGTQVPARGQTMAATTVAEAVDLINNQRPHLVITSLPVSDGSGFDIAHAAKGADPLATVVLVSRPSSRHFAKITTDLRSGLLTQLLRVPPSPTEDDLADVAREVTQVVDRVIVRRLAGGLEEREVWGALTTWLPAVLIDSPDKAASLSAGDFTTTVSVESPVDEERDPWTHDIVVRVRDRQGRPMRHHETITLRVVPWNSDEEVTRATFDAQGVARLTGWFFPLKPGSPGYQIQIIETPAAGLEEPALQQRRVEALSALEAVQRAARAEVLNAPTNSFYFLRDDAVLLAPAFQRLGLRFLVRVETAKAAKVLVQLGVPADRIAGALSDDESVENYRLQGVTRVASAAFGSLRFLIETVHQPMDPLIFSSLRTVQRIPDSDAAWRSFWRDWPVPGTVQAQLIPAVQATEAYFQAMG